MFWDFKENELLKQYFEILAKSFLNYFFHLS